MTTKEVEPFKGYALIELFGHRERAGMCEDVSMFGARLLKVDVPGDTPESFTTEFYGGAAIYGLHPCDEKTARRIAKDFSYDRAISPYHEPATMAIGHHPDFDDEQDEDHVDGVRG